jgi:two-component system, cell cycle sensor histidine kinase and response regulator CckA
MNIENTTSKEMFRTLFETMQEGFAIHEVVFDHDGQPSDYRFIDINPAFEKLTGLTRDKVIGKTVREVLPQIEEQLIETFCRVATSGKPAELEHYVKELDRYYRGRAYSPELNKFVVVFEDVTEQKKAMLELQRREEQLRVLFETSHAGIIMVDPSGVIVLANNRMAEMFGSSMEELIGSRYPDHVYPDQRNSGDDRMRKLIAGEIDHVSTERHYIRKDGSGFWGHLSGRRHEDSEGNFISLVGQIADITEMKVAEEAQRRSEERISLATQATNIGIWDWDIVKNLLSWDDSMYHLYGVHKEDFSGAYEAWSRTLHPEDLQLVENEIQAALRAERECAPEFRIIRPDGTVRFIKAASQTFFDENGTPLRMIGTNYDITERKKLEGELQNSLELFSLFMKYSPVYTFIKQIEGNQSRVLQISDNFVDMVGRPAEELRGRTMYDLFPEDFARKITEDDLTVVNEGKVIELDEQLNGRDYTTIKFPIIRDGKDNLIAGFTIDITDRKRAENEHEQMEKQLLHAQKLESLGVLAGGIAHDFNNILMAIIGNADLALMRVNKESPAVENLHRIEQAASRAADLAKQMLAYSGKGKFVVENIDLNRLLEEMLHMLEVSISKKAVLRLNQHQPLPSVEADATQLRQIIMNLVINASEAIGDKSGVIAITTGCMDCDRSYLKDVWLDENLANGLYVYLEIADTGCGMDKETMSKLFDPFFTTKFTGRGLGMAAVIGIVRGHKGAIKVYSEPDKGTTFKILFPASSRPAELFNDDSHTDGWQGSGTILLVDDEETVRGIGAEMLKELGFATITANDGCEAVEIFKSRDNIAFVILDLTMPHMDGEQCFRELRQLKPDVKVIMSSGYNEQEVTQKFVGKGLSGFIQKPYKLSTLKEVIREVV